MKSKIWLNRQKKDQFVIKSKQKGYLSRSSFKLIEIENKYNFIKQSKTAIDFGSAPGGWCQIMIKLNQNIKITAIDILDMKIKNRNINFYKKDFTQIDFNSFNNKYDLILSDKPPNTTGHKSTDHLKISNLINNIIDILDLIANFNSNLVIKIWKGSEETSIIDKLKQNYKIVSYFKPESSRKNSSEIYIVGQKFIN